MFVLKFWIINIYKLDQGRTIYTGVFIFDADTGPNSEIELRCTEESSTGIHFNYYKYNTNGFKKFIEISSIFRKIITILHIVDKLFNWFFLDACDTFDIFAEKIEDGKYRGKTFNYCWFSYFL